MLNALLLTLALFSSASADARPKRPQLFNTRVKVVADTAVWVIFTVTNNQTPDSTVVLVSATNQTTVRRRYFTVLTKTDSVKFTLPVPAAPIAGTINATAYKTGFAPSPPGVKTWGYTPTFEQPGVGEIIVRPATYTLDVDLAGACARWQASNPGVSPFITVNVKAIPTCTGTNNQPIVSLFCAFARLTDGTMIMTENTKSLVAPAHKAYCDAQFVSAKATVRS